MEINQKGSAFATLFARLICSSLALVMLIASIFIFYSAMIPESVSCFSGDDMPSYLGATYEELDSGDGESIVNITHGQYKLFGTIPIKSVTVAKLEDTKVYVGGIPFGIKFFTKGISVVGFDDETTNPAYQAGLRLYDTIIKVNGKEISGIAELSQMAECGGVLELTYLRAGNEGKIKFSPKYSEAEKKYTLGMWLKDSGAGIGTMTYVLPDGSFGGLGHGICDGDTGELIPIYNGSVLGVTVNGIVKGQKGNPGELKGYFNSSKVGALYKNTENGVFGALAQIPNTVTDKTYSIGLKGELKEGKATVICTLADNVRREYSIEISNINKNATGNKCFTVKITDEKLLNATGGIVQGMSGSPIIQNGKLVGAITHVLINDPTMGYGIFIENMLTQSTSATEYLPIAA